LRVNSAQAARFATECPDSGRIGRFDHASDLRFSGYRTKITDDAFDHGLTTAPFVQNLRRGHYEIAADQPRNLRLAAAFRQLATAI
jgi:hypothetical protein